VLESAASLLTCSAVVDEEAQALLAQLDYRADELELVRHRSALLLAAARFRRYLRSRRPMHQTSSCLAHKSIRRRSGWSLVR
jgi:hypothetical protein